MKQKKAKKITSKKVSIDVHFSKEANGKVAVLTFARKDGPLELTDLLMGIKGVLERLPHIFGC